jgi:hypothetical protein
MKNILSQLSFTTDIKDPRFKRMVLGGILGIIIFALFFGVAGYFAGKALYYFTH